MTATLAYHVRVLVPASALMIGAIAVAWTFSAVDDVPAQATESPFARSVSASKQPPLPPAAAFAAIADRPLFSPSRRPAQPIGPPAAPVTQIQPAAPPALSVTLTGIIISPERRAAILRRADGTSKAVLEGETVNGWLLKVVAPDQAQFSYGAATVELPFPIHQSSGDGTTASTAPGTIVRRRR